MESVNIIFSQKLREIEELNKAGKQIINLGIRGLICPLYPTVINILQEEAAKDNVHAYQSYKGSPILRNAISEWYLKNMRLPSTPNPKYYPYWEAKKESCTFV
jgi:aspartate/methionine/tyrosine aminotransferase